MISAEEIRSTVPATKLPVAPRIRSLWKFVICNSILLNAALAAATVLLLKWRLLLRSNVSSALSAAGLYFFRGRQGADSWGPMMEAIRCHLSGQPIYQTTFFVKNIKFQYPLPSLIPMYVMTKAGFGSQTIFAILNLLSWCTVWITIAASFWILKNCLQQRVGRLTQKEALSLGSLTVLSGIFFYPLVKGYSLGQIQCLVDALFALAFFSWIRRKESLSGVLIGIMCLIKPQYSIIILWFALRKRLSALAASLSVAGVGLFIAGVIFGWREQFAYLDVLSYMAKRGESFFENQSVNGLLHRLLMQGSNLKWEPNSFAPYSPLVYVISLISSLGFLALALFYPKLKKNAEIVGDFALIALAATMASPIVWEHHYGIVLPICAYLAGTLTRREDLKWLGAAFVLIGSSWSPFNVFAALPGLNMFQSLPFFGGVLLLLLFFRSTLSDRQFSPATTLVSSQFESSMPVRSSSFYQRSVCKQVLIKIQIAVAVQVYLSLQNKRSGLSCRTSAR